MVIHANLIIMYEYKKEREKIFTEEGQENFLKIRDKVQALITVAGCCTMGRAIQGALGDSWFSMACVDRLVELGEIKEITKQGEVAGQYRVFIKYD